MAHYQPNSDLPDTSTPPVSRIYAWCVFALTFGLLLSDYMSRQVLNAVFPLLKSEWALSDAQLGALSGVVALMVGALTFPLSLLADRYGRIRGLTLMAILWSLATLGCAISKSYEHMFAARLFVGIGEAAYGSVGIAVVLSVFPAHLRATLTGAFMAGGMFGSVLGMAGGGILAAHFGWRWSFAGMAFFGLALAAIYPLVVRESKVPGSAPKPRVKKDPAGQGSGRSTLSPLATLFGTRSVIAAYVGSGLQLFIAGSVLAWMPSFLNRYYDLSPDRAGLGSAVVVLVSGAGMILCGITSDRLCERSPSRKFLLAIVFCLLTFILLTAGFSQSPGPVQLGLVTFGMFFAAGTSGPAGAMVANLTHLSIHGTAFATLTLANNLLGLAPGPFITGALADRLGLQQAFQWIPMICLFSALAFFIGRRYYEQDLRKVHDTAAASL